MIKLLLAVKQPEILSKHIRDLLGEMLWKFTEADGKYKTRYKSATAARSSERAPLRHDHVFTRKQLIDRLLAAEACQIDGILTDAIGCIVTQHEHALLGRFDNTHSGWDRYYEAGLVIIDTLTGETVNRH